MYAIVTAGGIPEPGEPLYPYTQGLSKALLDINGKPMIQWVVDALDGSNAIHGNLVVGLEADCGVTSQKPLYFMPNQGSMLSNVLGGIQRVLEIDPAAKHVLLASSDVPGIRPEMVDWIINSALQTDDDIYYNAIEREVMERRYPGSRRSYTYLKGAVLCGGDVNVARTISVDKDSIWKDLIDGRKNVFRQASAIGWDVLFLLLLRQITVDEAVKKVSKRVGLKGRAIICPYAEVGMDVDKPFQLEIMRADLAKKAPA